MYSTANLAYKDFPFSSDIPPKLNEGFKFVEWQTWPFGEVQPNLFCQGISEKNDFIEVIQPAMHHVGNLTYWREISVII